MKKYGANIPRDNNGNDTRTPSSFRFNSHFHEVEVLSGIYSLSDSRRKEVEARIKKYSNPNNFIKEKNIIFENVIKSVSEGIVGISAINKARKIKDRTVSGFKAFNK